MRYEDASLSGSIQDQGPIARDDADQLAAGDRGPATGNLITGAGTETGAAGADSGNGARVTAVGGAGGQDSSFSGGRLEVQGEHGSLSVTARGDYVYRANAGVPENSRDLFTYTLTDAAGQSSQARLTIEIGKTQAVVAANAQRVVPGPDGVVVLPAGVELSDIRVVGRDLLIILPDGSQMLIVDGAVFVPQLVINDIEVPSTNLAALLIEQEPRPASGVPQSSGGNFATAVGPLDPGTPLGDLLPPTQLSYTPPEFRDVGQEEEEEEDLLPAVAANPPILLDDDTRAGGNAGGVGDDPDGTNLTGTLSGSGGDAPLTFALSTAGAPSGFAYVAGPGGSLLVQQNGVTVLTITLNPQTGAYTVSQNAPVSHPAGGDENNVLFTFSYTVTDEDGDSVTGTFGVNVDDDTPVIDVTAGADGGITLTTDDADTRGEASDAASSIANFGGVFGVSQSAGGDGAASSSLTFALGTSGGASGLKQGGADINLFLIGGKVVGSTAAGAAAVTAANTVFDVSVSSTGVVTLTQYGQIDHLGTDPSPTGAPFNDQLASLADNLVTLTASGLLSDRDGDSASDSVTVQIGANLRFTDDGPVLASVAAGTGVSIDETSAASAGFPVSATSSGAVITFAATSFGADGPAAAGATSYGLIVTGDGSTPLRTAQGDFPITLVQTSPEVITGTFVEGGVTRTAFTLTINADGSLTVRQSVPLGHLVDGSTPAAFDDTLDLAGLVSARVTIRDFDGDTASASAPIGDRIVFRDDGPDSRLAVEIARQTLVLDESRPLGSDTDGSSAPAGLASVTSNFASSFAAASFGADGAGTVAYSLVLSGSDVRSGLFAPGAGGSGRGPEILLNQSGNVVSGSVGGTTYFTIEIAKGTGVVTFTQLLPIWHPVPGVSMDEAAILEAATGSLLVRQTVTDSDGDSDSADLDISWGTFAIQDDAPDARNDTDSLAAGSYGPETGNVLTGAGTTSGAAGRDTVGADNALLVAVSSNNQPGNAASTNEAGALVIRGQYGTLTIAADGSYSYVRDEGTPGGVSDVFTYRLRDGDGDEDSATLTISVGDSPVILDVPPAGGATTTVDEKGLPPRGAEPAGSGEIADEVAGNNSDTSEAVSGTIGFVAEDGLASITVGGVTINLDLPYPQTVTDTSGERLLITGVNYDPETGQGTIAYSYTLKDNRLVDPSSASFAVVVTDEDGDTSSGNLVITILDDVPTASDDMLGTIAEDVPFSFNPFGNDVFGADGVATNDATKVTVTQPVAGGTASYNPATGLITFDPAPGFAGPVSFTYTIIDGDGDSSTATVTLTVAPDSTPTVMVTALTVDEKGLPARPGESQGSDAAGSSEVSGQGTITVTTGNDSLSKVEVQAANGSWIDVTAATAAAPIAVQGADGVLTVSRDGSGNYVYTYVLTDNLENHPDNIVDADGDRGTADPLTGDSFPVRITDSDGDQATTTIAVTVLDDGPTLDITAASASVAEGQQFNGSWSLTPGADGVSSVSVTFGSASGTLVLTSGNSLVLSQPTGTLTVRADGTYSFAAALNQDNDATPAPSATFTITGVDGDGDQARDSLTIAILDGQAAANAAPVTLTVSEAALGNANATGSNPASTAESTSGSLSFTAGSDALTSFVFSTDLSALAANIDGSGTDLFWTRSPDGKTITGSLTSGGPAAITITLAAPSSIAAGATGLVTVSVTLADNLPHALAMAAQTAVLGSIDVLASDHDGDTASGTVNLRVTDDVPAAGNDSLGTIAEDVPFSFNPFGNDVFGADGVAINDATKVTVTQPAAGGTASYNPATGLITFDPAPGFAGPVSFTYTIIDGDGDPSTATVNLTVAPDSTPVVQDAAARIDDDGLAGGNAGGTGDIDANLGDAGPNTSEAIFSGQISVAFGNDAAGATITFANLDGTTGMVGTEQVTYRWNSSTNVLRAESASRGDIFTVSINPSTGAYTVTLLQNVLHATGGNENSVDVALNYRATDSDNDVNETGRLIITFNDDTPQFGTVTSPLQVINSGTVSATGQFGFSLGGDGPPLNNDVVSSVTLNSVTVNGQPVSSFSLTPGAEDATTASYAISFTYLSGPGVPASASGTLVINKSTGQYTVDFDAPIQGFSVESVQTGQAPIFYDVDINGDGDTTDAADQNIVAVVQTSSDFFIQFTGRSSVTGSDGTFGHDELFVGGTREEVKISSTAIGVKGNTVQPADVLDYNFYSSNPGAVAGQTPTASAETAFIQITQFNGSEDFILVLKLADPNNLANIITRTVVVNANDVLTSSVPGYPTLGNNEGLIIVEPNDYLNLPGVPAGYELVGLQLRSSSNGLGSEAGEIYNFNGQLNAFDNSTTSFNAATNDNEVFKILDIGVVRQTTTNQQAILNFTATIQDEDGDTASTNFQVVVGSSGSSSTLTSSSLLDNAVMMSTDELNADLNFRSASVGNSLALSAGLAAGFAALPAAAAPANDSFGSVVEQAGSGREPSPTLRATGDGSAAPAGTSLAGQEAAVLNGGAGGGGDGVQQSGRYEKVALDAREAAGSHEARTALDQGTEAVGVEAAAPLFAGGEVHMPAPDQLALIAAARSVSVEEGKLGSVLSDALAGGSPDGEDLGELIAAAARLAGPPAGSEAGEVTAPFDGELLSEVASPLSAAVSAWDGGDFGALFTAASTAMDGAAHPDAVSTTANG